MQLRSFFTAQLSRKVPMVAVLFWIIKLLTTAMGESTSDYFVNAFNPYAVVILGFIAFAIALVIQFAVKRYVACVYWATVLLVAVFGTMAADVTHVEFGVPYVVSMLGFGAALAVIFYLWSKTEKTLSIHSVTNRGREMFYWATVLATFALGTAAGDFLAYSLHLGFFTAGIVFAVIFAVPAIGYRFFQWNAIFSFWFAYIITRPLGASFADWTGKAKSTGGLGWGDGIVAAILGTLIIILVGYLAATKRDVER